jgi:hypothetical protein
MYYRLAQTKGTKAQARAVNLAYFDKTAKERERIIYFAVNAALRQPKKPTG